MTNHHSSGRVMLLGYAAGLAMLLAAPGCRHRLPLSPTPLKAQPKQLKILTLNVNYGAVDPPRMAAMLLRADADVVALQETTPRWEREIRRRLGRRYPHMAFRHSGGAGGMAFLTKRPFVDLGQSTPPRGGWFPAWIVRTKTTVGTVHLLNVHLRPPLDAGRGSSFVSAYFRTPRIRDAEIKKHVRKLPKASRVVVLGDFNEGSGGRAVSFLKGGGYTSALDSYDKTTATWHWRWKGIPLRARLDHILYRGGLSCVAAQVLGDVASDHFPVEAVFRLK